MSSRCQKKNSMTRYERKEASGDQLLLINGLGLIASRGLLTHDEELA